MPEFKPTVPSVEKQEEEKKMYPEYRVGNGLVRLFEEKSDIFPEELKQAFPGRKLLATDFYLQGAERGEKIIGGYKLDNIDNIDHHAPSKEMMRFVSSTNLAIEKVLKSGPAETETLVIINHTDCDSMLSSLILRGELPPELKFGAAAIAADHTGAKDSIADLLQAIAKKRDYEFSARNLKLFLENKEVDEEAKGLLKNRRADREKIKKLIEEGKFQMNEYGVAYIETEKKLDGELAISLLPEAKVIVLAGPMPEYAENGKWNVGARLGLAAPPGISLLDLNLPDFGGRWNAGSTKRHGGTKFTAKEYAEFIGKKL